MRDHTKLRAFEVADDVALRVCRLVRQFPSEERFGLAAQMRRAAVSTPCNIVEGCARHSEAELLRFLDIAYGSARELEYQTTLARRLEYISEQEFASLHSACVESSKVLAGLIRSLRSAPHP